MNQYLWLSLSLTFVVFLISQLRGQQRAHVVYLGVENEKLIARINDLEKHNKELLHDLDKTMKENILLNRALARMKFPDLPAKGDLFGGKKGRK